MGGEGRGEEEEEEEEEESERKEESSPNNNTKKDVKNAAAAAPEKTCRFFGEDLRHAAMLATALATAGHTAPDFFRAALEAVFRPRLLEIAQEAPAFLGANLAWAYATTAAPGHAALVADLASACEPRLADMVPRDAARFLSSAVVAGAPVAARLLAAAAAALPALRDDHLRGGASAAVGLRLHDAAALLRADAPTDLLLAPAALRELKVAARRRDAQAALDGLDASLTRLGVTHVRDFVTDDRRFFLDMAQPESRLAFLLETNFLTPLPSAASQVASLRAGALKRHAAIRQDRWTLIVVPVMDVAKLKQPADLDEYLRRRLAAPNADTSLGSLA